MQEKVNLHPWVLVGRVTVGGAYGMVELVRDASEWVIMGG